KTYTEEFQITASNVTKYAEQNGAVKVLPTYSNQTYMIMAGVGILIISIFVFVWWRKKNEKQREELKAS
ncbi:LPXTG cell wall anchor domain-containing protein, partial [Bacillus thuringiensis]